MLYILYIFYYIVNYAILPGAPPPGKENNKNGLPAVRKDIYKYAFSHSKKKTHRSQEDPGFPRPKTASCKALRRESTESKRILKTENLTFPKNPWDAIEYDNQSIHNQDIFKSQTMPVPWIVGLRRPFTSNIGDRVSSGLCEA